MSYSRQLLDSYPGASTVDAGILAVTIDVLNDCAQACTADADDDLSEHHVADLVRCIRLCLDCADVCAATVAVTSRQTGYDAEVTTPLLEACAAVCKSCGDECEGHAQMHEHCRVCAEACRRGEQACRDLLSAMKLRQKPQLPVSVAANGGGCSLQPRVRRHRSRARHRTSRVRPI